MRRLAIVAAGIGLVAVCASACVPLAKGQKMRERIESLEAQQKVLREKVDEQQKTFDQRVQDAKSDVEELRKVLEEAKKVLQRNSADLGAELQSVRQEVQKLRGEIETTQFRLDKLQREIELFKKDVDLRFADRGPGDLPDEADALYGFGTTKLEEGNLRAARQAFDKFLERHAGSDRADNAQYWKAEALFRKGEWVNSVFEYRKVFKKWENSEFVDEATYKIGLAFTKIGKCEQAKTFFLTVVEDYSDTDTASKAQSELDAIEAGKCGSGASTDDSGE